MADLDLGDRGRGVVAPPSSRRHAALIVVIASGMVRLAIAALTPVFPDEAYYWDWSRHLAPGYYDHPPMIAALIRLGTSVFGDTPLGVRAGAVLAGVVAICFLCAAARRIAGERAALMIAVLFAVMPLSAAGLILATPDAPLLASASATIYALVRALEMSPGSAQSTKWWCIAGLAIGLAFCSKLTAVLFPFAVFVAFLARRELRPRLAEGGPYVAILIALAVFLPVVLWNSRHGWVSFGFQLQHGFGGTSGSMLKRELDLLGGQAGLVSPILFGLCIVAVARGLRSSSPRIAQLFAVVSIVIFAFFVYSATRRRVEANWPALAFIPAVLLVATHPVTRTWERWIRAGIGLAAVLTLVTYVNAFTPVLPVAARRDPAARASGWDELATVVQRVRGSGGGAPARTWVAGERYQEASALAFHLPDHPVTFSVNLTGRANQYDLWPAFAQRARPGDALILVVDDVSGRHAAVDSLAPHFGAVTQGPQVPLARHGDLVKNLRVWVLDGWRGTWPVPRLRSRT